MSHKPPRCQEPTCPVGQVLLLKETDNEWVFGCLTCKSVMVRSKPSGIAKARYYRDLRDGRTFRTSYDKERLILT